MSEKLDIFEVLQKIDAFDLEYVKSLTPDQRKSVAPYMLMLWMGGCKSPEQILKVNAFLNHFVFDLGSHPDLLYKLALVSSDSKPKKYKWLKKKTNSKKYSTSVGIIKKYYDCSSQHALEYVKLLDSDTVIEFAIELGEQDDVVKKIKKEFA